MRVTAQPESQPESIFRYGNRQGNPRFQSEDLSSDALAANELGMKNLKVVMENLEEWTAGVDDENYTLMKELYNAVISHKIVMPL